MATIASSPVSHIGRVGHKPTLEAGDHLTLAEFEERFDNTPGLKKAELIEGVVYMPPPVSEEFHATPHTWLNTWIGVYAAMTPGVLPGDNGTLRVNPKNGPQPDVYLRRLRGGQTRRDAEGYVVGVPELVAEVSASSVSYDSHVKRDMYERHGVKEYLIWRVYDGALDWWIARDGKLVSLAPGADGIHRCETFPGLWLDSAALIREDIASVLKTLHQGLSHPEHAAFVERLKAGTS